jgi:hypothetical protein
MTGNFVKMGKKADRFVFFFVLAARIDFTERSKEESFPPGIRGL